MPLLASKPRILWGDYVEECYEYKQETYVVNLTSFRWEPPGCQYLICMFCECDIIEYTNYYEFPQDTDECAKWHLVRYEDESEKWWLNKETWNVNSTE